VTNSKPSHVKWIDNSDVTQDAWIKEQLVKKGVSEGGFFNYVKGYALDEHARLHFAEQARLMGNYWRSIQSRKGKTTITISESAARTIRTYCDRQDISATTLLDGYAKSLKVAPTLYSSGLTLNTKTTILGEVETISRLSEALLDSITELATDQQSEKNIREAEGDKAVELLRQIEQRLEGLKRLASTSRNTRSRNTDSLL